MSNKLELVKKYIKVNELGKAMTLALNSINTLDTVDKKEMVAYFLDSVLIPMKNDSVIIELEKLIEYDKEVHVFFLDKIKNYQWLALKKINLDEAAIENVKDIFFNLNFEDVAKENAKANFKEESFKEAKVNIYGKKFSTIKQDSIKEVNKLYFEVENRTEIDILIKHISDLLYQKLEKINNPNNIFLFFYDEILFDVELILKRLILTKDVLCEKMLETYAMNAIPCNWSGNYPEGKISFVSN